MSIRDRLDEIRRIYHISQSEMARRIGVTPQLLSQVVNEKIQISYLTAKAIESEFGVNAEWIMRGTGEMLATKDNKARDIDFTPELVSALKCFPGIVSALNELSSRMTLQDWEALNSFLTREKAVAD